MPDSELSAPPPRILEGAHGRPVPGRTEMVIMVAALMALNALAIDIMLPALGQIAESTGLTSASSEDSNRQQMIVFAYVLGFDLSPKAYSDCKYILTLRTRTWCLFYVNPIGTL